MRLLGTAPREAGGGRRRLLLNLPLVCKLFSTSTVGDFLASREAVAVESEPHRIRKRDWIAAALKGQRQSELDWLDEAESVAKVKGLGRRKTRKFVREMEGAKRMAELNLLIHQASDCDRLGEDYMLEDVVLDDIRQRKPHKQVHWAKKALTQPARIGKRRCWLSAGYVPPGNAYGRHAREAIRANPSYDIIKYGFDFSEEREVYNRIHDPDRHLIR